MYRMIQGRCPKCGAYYHGWSLLSPRHQSCARCGTALEISNGNTVFRGYSPFEDDGYSAENPADITGATGRENEDGYENRP